MVPVQAIKKGSQQGSSRREEGSAHFPDPPALPGTGTPKLPNLLAKPLTKKVPEHVKLHCEFLPSVGALDVICFNGSGTIAHSSQLRKVGV